MSQGLGLGHKVIFFLLAILAIQLAAFTFALDSLAGGQRSKREAAAVVDLFRANCARCHGADGRGDTPLGHQYQSPDFTDREWWRKHADITSTAKLNSIVTRGKGGMPAFGKKLKPREIRSLVNYVRRFQK